MNVVKGMTAEMTEYWTISCAVTDPVHFSASATGESVDEAAAKVIRDLTTVGALLPTPES
jgi:hypothetical protein